MGKITNLGVLDVREIKEDLAKEITQIENIGLLIESDESQVLLKHANKINIGTSMKIPLGLNLKFVMKNGEMIIDKEYLESIVDPIAIIMNGILVFKKGIDPKVLDEMIYTIVLNGRLISPKKLSGLIESKGMINGEILSYTSDYEFFCGTTEITNRFLKVLKPDSKLAFENLVIINNIDMDIFKEKISNIQVLKKLIIINDYEDEIAQLIDEYYGINKTVIPNSSKGFIYIEDDIKLDNNSIKKYKGNGLYINGVAEIEFEENIDFQNHIECLICDKVICDEKTYNMIKDSLSDEVEVEIIKGRLINNKGKMVMSEDLEQEVTIKNMGKLIFNENLNADNLEKSVSEIINYGLIEAPKNLINIITKKVKQNYGKIREPIEKNEEVQKEEKEDILYSNMAMLKL